MTPVEQVGAVEIPAYLSVVVIYHYIGRKPSASLLLSVLVVCVASSAFIPQGTHHHETHDLPLLHHTMSRVLNESMFTSACDLAVADLTTVILTVTTAGKFAVTTLFNMLYIYSSELYPTDARVMGLSVSSCFARVGSVLSPFAVELVRARHRPAPRTRLCL